MVYSTRRFVLCLTLCYFVLVFFIPFSIAITSLVEETANLSAFCMFVRFVLAWFCRFPLPLGVWEGLRFVIVAFPGLLFLPFFTHLIKMPVYHAVLIKFNTSQQLYIHKFNMDLKGLYVCLWVVVGHLFLCTDLHRYTITHAETLC